MSFILRRGVLNAKCTLLMFDSDYDVFLSPLSDFKAEMEKAGLSEKVVYLDRGDGYKFKVLQ